MTDIQLNTISGTISENNNQTWNKMLRIFLRATITSIIAARTNPAICLHYE